MIRVLILVACLAPFAVRAQSAHDHGGGANAPAMRHGMSMDGPAAPGAAPLQPGQAPIAAIQEIVGLLEADPATDWSKVNIDALRRHLVDMSAVTLSADVKTESVEGGARFTVTGAGPVRESIRRMVTAHAATMNGVDGWRFEAAEVEGGATLVVRPAAKDAAKLPGLGFFGVMTRGMHHQEHHLMIARGGNPHR